MAFRNGFSQACLEDLSDNQRALNLPRPAEEQTPPKSTETKLKKYLRVVCTCWRSSHHVQIHTALLSSALGFLWSITRLQSPEPKAQHVQSWRRQQTRRREPLFVHRVRLNFTSETSDLSSACTGGLQHASTLFPTNHSFIICFQTFWNMWKQNTGAITPRFF